MIVNATPAYALCPRTVTVRRPCHQIFPAMAAVTPMLMMRCRDHDKMPYLRRTGSSSAVPWKNLTIEYSAVTIGVGMSDFAQKQHRIRREATDLD